MDFNRCNEQFNMSLGNSADEKAQNEQRRRDVRHRLSTVAKDFKKAQVEVAGLLDEVQSNKYWQGDFSSFAEYVDREVGISVRTAQELVRVIRACRNADVQDEDIARLGWSKIALVAKELSKGNAKQLLKHVEDTCFADLKKENRKKSGFRKSEPRSENHVQLTETIHEALRLSAAETHDASLQANLQFIAEAFIKNAHRPSPYTLTENPN